MNGVVTAILISLFLVILIAIILIIVLGDRGSNTNVNIPEKIDVVIIDRGRGRAQYQLQRIDKYMNWVHAVIVVKILNSPIYPVIHTEILQTSSERPVINVETDKLSLLHIFEAINNIAPEISDHFIFFGDTTAPIRSVPIWQFWSISSKLRMFNYLNVDARTIGFEEYYETTMPVMVVNLKDLTSAGNLDYYLLSLSVTSKLVYSPFINSMVILTNNEFTDEQQLNKSSDLMHLFITGLISPPLDQKSSESMNQKIINLLS